MAFYEGVQKHDVDRTLGDAFLDRIREFRTGWLALFIRDHELTGRGVGGREEQPTFHLILRNSVV